MSFTEAVQSAFANFANVEGRATRSEYWWFVLFNMLAAFVTAFVVTTIAGELVGSLAQLAVSFVMLVPSITVCARRLHDTGRSGWWQLLSITIIGVIPLLIWLASEGTPGPNAYGAPRTGQLGVARSA